MTELVDAQFYAPLKTTLMPTNSAGTPTFTRATTKSIFDHEGILRTIPSGHQSHGGSRVVENLIGNASDYFGVSTTARSIIVTAGTYAFSMGAGSGVVTFGGTAGATGTLTAHATDRVGVIKTLSSGTFTFVVSVVAIFDVMLENITGKSVQVPSAYEPITVDQSTDFIVMHKGQVTPSYSITLAATPGTYTWENSDGITASNVTTFSQPLKKSYGAVKLVVDPVKLLTIAFNSTFACGSIPSLSANTALVSFFCNTNQLTGSIPNLSTNTALVYFFCYGNQLTGSIPSLSANTALTIFYCHSNQLTGSIPSLSANTALTQFNCSSNQLTGSIPILSTNTALTQFNCSENQLTGSIPILSTNTALVNFYCNTNQLTGSIPSLSANTALTIFYCHNNQLTGYLGGGVSINLGTLQAQNNILTQSAVDLILSDFVAANKTTGTRVLNIGGTGNASPSAAGIVNKNILISRGWTVTTN